MNYDVKHATFLQIQSRLGNKIVAPDIWTAQDKGDLWSLFSPDGQALIHVYSFTVKGSGSLKELGEQFVVSLLPQGATGWRNSEWRGVMIGEKDALKRDLVPAGVEKGIEWCVYALQHADLYHVIVLNASSVAMRLNGETYEGIIRTFQGAERGT